MGKLFVSDTPHTPIGRVRETLDEAERLVSNLRACGAEALRLLPLLDRVSEELTQLEAAGVDVRAERVRFETVLRQLRSRQSRFVAQTGAALRQKRATVQPDQSHWWWFLDQAVAQQRRTRLRRALSWGLAVIGLLAVAAWAYDRFVAPPPEVRRALEHTATGERLVDEGDLRAALAEFEAAASLTPADPEPWLWRGVVYHELNEPAQAEAAFEVARSLYDADFDFFLERGVRYLRVGNLDMAGADAEQAIAENPQSGHGYYLRANVATRREDYAAALADLERAVELAQESGDTQLEAIARTQRALVIQAMPGP